MPTPNKALHHDRRTLRAKFRKRRKSITRAARQRLETALCNALLASPHYQQADCVAAYVAADGEPDVLAALREENSKHLALPVVAAEGSMTFRTFESNGTMQTNRYGIAEPQGTGEVSVEAIDLILAPLVAFDNDGRRLGMGGGYYDRYFGRLEDRPTLAGIAFSCQRADVLPEEHWDIKLDLVVTEQGIQTF